MKELKGSSKKYLWLTILIFVLSNCTDSDRSLANTTPEDKAKKIQIALLLDTSNSMDGLIEQAKSQLWNIVNELSRAKCDNTQPELQIALYEYGNDNLPSSEGYIRLVTSLTDDLDEISKNLFELRTNGGNEFCGEVIGASLKQLDWTASNADLKLIYIAGNEPFTQGRINYRTVCKDASEKRVIINTIHCGDFQEGINTSWKNGADLTGGSYASIEQNRRTVYIESPWDEQISKLNDKLNDTYLPYGSLGATKKQNQLEQDSNADSYGSVNKVKRAISKSSYAYKNTQWDLVDAAKEEEFELSTISREALPTEMQNMDTDEQKAYIDKMSTERAKINSEIQALNEKRRAYVASQQQESDSKIVLEKAIISALNLQAKAKGFVIE